MDAGVFTAEVLDMYSDASRNFLLGFGAYCNSQWCCERWERQFCEEVQPSIEYLELYAVAVAVVKWLHLFENKRVVIFCDNQAVVQMLNNSSSRCKNCMVLIRIVTLESMLRNSRVYGRFVRSKDNGKADALSRMDFERFTHLSAGSMDENKSEVPNVL